MKNHFKLLMILLHVISFGGITFSIVRFYAYSPNYLIGMILFGLIFILSGIIVYKKN